MPDDIGWGIRCRWRCSKNIAANRKTGVGQPTRSAGRDSGYGSACPTSVRPLPISRDTTLLLPFSGEVFILRRVERESRSSFNDAGGWLNLLHGCGESRRTERSQIDPDRSLNVAQQSMKVGHGSTSSLRSLTPKSFLVPRSTS